MSPLVRLPFAVAVALGTAALLLAGCHGFGARKPLDGGADADAEGGVAVDANLPETVTIILEAGVEPDGKPTRVTEESVPPMALPRPCLDKTLGTMTFVQDGAKVKIGSSKGLASATCVRMDEHKLLCDWADKSGTPTATRRAVSYGPKTKIAGTYDGKHSFACPAQSDLSPPTPPGKKRK